MCQGAQKPYRPAGEKPSVKGLYLSVLLAAALLYGLTCQRGLSWQDSGMFQVRVQGNDFGFASKLGLALAHPLYITAGWLLKFIPIGQLPLRLNFFSGLGMAVALANLAAVCALLTGRRSVAAAVAGLLALAHTPWWLATIAEVYTWSLAGFTAELWLLVLLIRRPSWGKLAGLALLSGAGLALHNFALLPLPVYLIVAVALAWRRRLPAWSLAVAAGAYLVGAGPYLAMTVAKAVETGSAGLAVRSALFGSYQPQVLGTVPRPSYQAANVALVCMNLINVLLPLAVVGAWVLKRRVGAGLAWPVWALAAIQIVFAVRYFVPDQFTFFLPSYAMLALLAAVGMDALIGRTAEWRRVVWTGWVASVVLMPFLYGVAPSLARRLAPSAVQRPRKLPFRNEARYWLTPWKHNEDSAERLARAAFEQVEPDAVIVAEATPYYALAAAQEIHGLGPTVTLLGGHEPWPVPRPTPEGIEAFFAAIGDRPLYVVTPHRPHCPPALIQNAEFERAGVLYRVTFKGAAAAGPD